MGYCFKFFKKFGMYRFYFILVFAALIIGCSQISEKDYATKNKAVTAALIEETYESGESDNKAKDDNKPYNNLRDENNFSNAEKSENINQIKEKITLNCSQGWKCLDKFNLGYQISNCSSNFVKYCEKGCLNGSCIPLCKPGNFTCVKNVSRICDEDGSYWSYYKSCEYGCENGQCLAKNESTELKDLNFDIVAEVIDGDIIKLQSGEKLRLIGINAPEEGQSYYLESKNKLKELAEGKNASFEKDLEDQDQYGNLFRYVFINGENVNVLLVKEGFAELYISEPNIKYKSDLESAWQQCLKNKVNLCEINQTEKNSCDGSCIEISDFHYDAGGNDCNNLTDEYVSFKNNCLSQCKMTNWSVKDESSNEPYYFPNFILESGSYTTLYTGCGTDTNEQLYWCNHGHPCNAIWNNNGDTLYLRSQNGDLIINYTYS